MSRAEYCSCQGPSSGQKSSGLLEIMRLTGTHLLLVVQTLQKKSPLMNPDDT